MNFLYAQAPAGGQPSLLASLLPLIILFAIFYFLVILPQQRQAKKHKQMVEELKKGDKIITTGGIIAEVVKNEPDFLKVRINDSVEVKLDKSAVARKLNDEKA
ncbi:preprotein translocase subunit YajC [Nautilia sp. PV-1]|uniref:preprotein translocase subunit YajC n=1 Tax=Nautilia sp. PV-1 TaxID=2579250 RepID=UPI000FDC9299|nr:preprotein translocase subunit YajC [Nautilia sp. PV-1]AZV47166.1 preprotein translocase subunit YajC [Nautilia sp. PV-1]